MKNNINKKPERVEVMALFGYEMTPCRPLSFKRRGGSEVEVTELLSSRVKFSGKTTVHIFDVVANHDSCQLQFNSSDLSWHVAA